MAKTVIALTSSKQMMTFMAAFLSMIVVMLPDETAWCCCHTAPPCKAFGFRQKAYDPLKVPMKTLSRLSFGQAMRVEISGPKDRLPAQNSHDLSCNLTSKSSELKQGL
jgi:hypothetical protein